jgi:hypothetical protein
VRKGKEVVMLIIISKLHDILNQFKGIEAGYTTRNTNQMIVNFEGKNYKLTIEEVGEGDIMEHIDRL